MRSAVRVISPSSPVNLEALDRRLKRIWRTRTPSATTVSGASSSLSVQSWRLALRRLAVSRDRAGDRLAQVGRRQGQRHPAGLDLGEVEHAVDQRQQVAAVPQHGLEELALLGVDLAGAAVEHQVGEADDGVERRAELVGHVGQELALELGGALELEVLGRQRALVPAALLQHRRPVEADDHLVAQGLEQLQVVIAERPAVAPVVDADRADDDARRAERDDRRGAERDRRGPAPGSSVGRSSMSSESTGVSWVTTQPTSESIRPARACRRRRLSGPVAAATRRKRPSSASSVTAPLSASSRSAAALATSPSSRAMSVPPSSVAARWRSRSSSRLRAPAASSARRSSALRRRPSDSPRRTAAQASAVVTSASAMPSQCDWKAK